MFVCLHACVCVVPHSNLRIFSFKSIAKGCQHEKINTTHSSVTHTNTEKKSTNTVLKERIQGDTVMISRAYIIYMFPLPVCTLIGNDLDCLKVFTATNIYNVFAGICVLLAEVAESKSFRVVMIHRASLDRIRPPQKMDKKNRNTMIVVVCEFLNVPALILWMRL